MSLVTPKVVAQMTNMLYHELYDEASEIPECHMEWWDMCCSDDKFVAIGAPRGHAKSSAVTFAYVLTKLIFREAGYVLIISNTEDQAAKFVTDIGLALKELTKLHKEPFNIRPKLVTDSSSKIVGKFKDGEAFCVEGAGSATPGIRGKKWRHRRPDLVILDDFEDKDICESEVARPRFKARFMGTVIPGLSRSGKIRCVGTVLHEDSVLMNLLKSSKWTSAVYEAHDDNFQNILWPERFDEQYFRDLYTFFSEEGKTDEYMQEYRNKPINPDTARFTEASFIPMEEKHFNTPMTIYPVVDQAASGKSGSDYTAIGVFGIDALGNIYILDMYNERLESDEWLELVLEINSIYKPETTLFEDGAIWKATQPWLEKYLDENPDITFNYDIVKTGNKDKEIRLKPFQHRCRARKVYINTEMETYEAFIAQMIAFPRGKNDDMADTCGYIGMYLLKLLDGPTTDEYVASKQAEAMEEENRSFNEAQDAEFGYDEDDVYYSYESSMYDIEDTDYDDLTGY